MHQSTSNNIRSNHKAHETVTLKWNQYKTYKWLTALCSEQYLHKQNLQMQQKTD